MFCMDKFFISSFQLEQIATIWAMDNIHHFMAIIHSFPESPFRLSQIPMAVKINVSPKTPAIWISLGGSIH